jgi:hypothetical protein
MKVVQGTAAHKQRIQATARPANIVEQRHLGPALQALWKRETMAITAKQQCVGKKKRLIMIVDDVPSTAHIGVRQALTALDLTSFVDRSKYDKLTVHAPHPPSPHPSFVPVRPPGESRNVFVTARRTSNTFGAG